MTDSEWAMWAAFTAADIRLPANYNLTPRGWPRALLGLYPILPDCHPAREQSGKIILDSTTAELLASPNLCVSPIHYAAALRPSGSLHHFLDEIKRSQDARKLESHAWSNVHTDTLTDTLRLVVSTCESNGVDGRMKIEDPALLARFSVQIRHLCALKYSISKSAILPHERLASTGEGIDKEFAKRRLAALRELADKQPWIWRVIPGNWFHPTISRRSSRDQSPQAQALRGVESRTDERKFLYTTRLADLDAHELSIGSPSRDLGSHAEITGVSALAPPNNLGRAAWHRILRACATDRAEAAAVQLTVCAAVRLSSLGASSIELASRCAVVRTIVTLPAANAARNHDLHYGTSNEFVSFAPRACGEKLLEILSRMPAEEIEERASAWLSSIVRGATYSKLLATMRHQVPAWHAVDPSYFEFGLNPHPSTRPAWCHYVVWDPKIGGKALTTFIRTHFDRPFAIPSSAQDKVFGSAYLPRLAAVRRLIRTYRSMTSAPVGGAVATILETLNAVAACARILEGLFSFTRSRDAFSPMRLLPVEQWRLIFEKRFPRIIYFPLVWRREALRLRKYLIAAEQLLLSSGYLISGSEILRESFWFLESDLDADRKCLVRARPTRAGVYAHLNRCEAARRHAELDSHAMRCFSNFWLRHGSDLPHATVAALHDHSMDREQSAISWDTLRRPLLQAEHEHAANYLARLIELS
jgi:hypothetical protein